MNLLDIKNDLPIQCIQNLKALYEMVCEECRRRLADLWDFPLDEGWWVADRIGTELCIADAPWGLDMEMISYVVEHEVSFKSFMEWWDFVEEEIHNGYSLPRINFRSWFEMNCRPDILKD